MSSLFTSQVDGPGALKPGDHGIDISHWQRLIDFLKLKALGYTFVVIKSADGATFVDVTFAKFYDLARAAGLLLSTYLFYQPGQHPIKQADYFVDHLDGRQFDFRLALDLEQTLPYPPRFGDVRACCDHIGKRTGLAPYVYTNQGTIALMQQTFREVNELVTFPLWVSSPRTSPAVLPYGLTPAELVRGPSMPAGWIWPEIWQYRWSHPGFFPPEVSRDAVDLDLFLGPTPALPAATVVHQPVGRNQDVINLFSRAGGAAYVDWLTRAGIWDLVLANRYAPYAGPAIELMTGLTGIERNAVIAQIGGTK